MSGANTVLGRKKEKRNHLKEQLIMGFIKEYSPSINKEHNLLQSLLRVQKYEFDILYIGITLFMSFSLFSIPYLNILTNFNTLMNKVTLVQLIYSLVINDTAFFGISNCHYQISIELQVITFHATFCFFPE